MKKVMDKVTIALEGQYIVVYSPSGEELQVYPLARVLGRPGTLEDWLFFLLTGRKIAPLRRKVAKEFAEEINNAAVAER